MTPSEYAAHAGVTRQAVMSVIAAGHLRESARKIRGRWAIDAEKADHEWKENVRPWTSGSAGRYAEANRVAAAPHAQPVLESLYAATCRLVGEIADIEVRLSRAFRRSMKLAGRHVAETAAFQNPWVDLYHRWGALPDTLEQLQLQARHALAEHQEKARR